MSDLHQFLCMLPVATARFSSGGVAMYSGFMDDVVMTGICEKKVYTQSDPPGAAPYRLRYLMIALFTLTLNDARRCS